MMKLVFATNNQDKLREAREILSGTAVRIISQSEAGCRVEVNETGETFRENARLKAEAVLRATGLPAVADDSGLEITALGNRPGIFSARYGGTELSYEKKCQKLVDELDGQEDRSARFVCSVVCLFPNGDELDAEGVLEGTIGSEAEGTGGFGYDPIFVPEGSGHSIACYTEEEKNAVSHRGKAFREITEKLEKYMEKQEKKE